VKIENDIIFSYLLYLNDYSFRESMIETALKTVDQVEATTEHFLACGIVDESDMEVRELYSDMASSYSIELPGKESKYCEEWKIIQEFRLSKLGYTFPKKSINTLVYDYELACIHLICLLAEGDRRFDSLAHIYASRSSDYEAYMEKLAAMARLTDSNSNLGISFRSLVSFIEGYSYGGVGDYELREVTKVLESLL